jgi:predicted acyltransferase
MSGEDISRGLPMPRPEDRVASVDALRGLVILLMIFVNDVAGVRAAPSWLQHGSVDADGMTLPDVVFPAFLFIMGMSIPLSLGRALDAGRSRFSLLAKVLARTLALLLLGVFMVNMDRHDPGHRGLWGLLTYLAIFLAFPVVPPGPPLRRRTFQVWRVIGFVGLAVLALVYRTADGRHLLLGPLLDSSDTIWLRHSWWGILGLIGWAYLVASLVYLVLGRRREWLIGATGLLAMVYVADRHGLFARVDSRAWLAWAAPAIGLLERLYAWVGSHVSIGQSLGSLASISVAGWCLGTIVSSSSEIRTHPDRLRWALGYAAGLTVAALLFDPLYGINKIRATPAWGLLCSSLTALTWAALYWIMDVRGVRPWSAIVGPAGANPLMAYILHPFVLIGASVERWPAADVLQAC